MILILIMAAVILIGPLGNIAALDSAWRAACLPRARPVRSEWCEENLRLPGEFSAQPGHFSFRGREYQRELIDAVDDPNVREIVFQAPPQVGKTEFERAVIQSQGEVDAAPMMFAGPDQPYAREQREVVYQAAAESPVLSARIPPDRLRNDRWIDLQRCLVFLAWSGSSQRLSGRSCKVVLCSEVDRWQLSVNLAAQRTKAFWNSCVIYEGSPVGASPTIAGLYEQSDRRTFRVPCPHCGHFQELRFFTHKRGEYAGCGGIAGLKGDGDEWRTAEESRKQAYYICEKGCRIEGRDKAGMVARGVWCPDGCDVVDGEIVGESLNPGRRRGYRLNAMYAPTCSFGDVAEAYIRLRDTEEGRLSFWNDWLGLAFVPRGTAPNWQVLGSRLAGEYPRGYVPKWAYFLTAGADVQANGIFWIIRAWGDRVTSGLVDFGFFPLTVDEDDEAEAAEHELAADLVKLEKRVLQTRWDVLGTNPRGLSRLAVRMLAIDRGFRQIDVDDFVRRNPGDRVIAVFGSPKITPGELYRPTKIERDPKTGEKIDDGIIAWGIETGAYKTDIADRWTADRRLPGVWWLPNDILETRGGEDYLRQITAERRSVELIKGRRVLRWVLPGHATPNHHWDDEVYARAAADMVTGGEWKADNWPGEPVPSRDDGPVEELAARYGGLEDCSAR